MTIRAAGTDDLDSVWQVFEQVIKAGDTFAFDPDTPKEELSNLWFAPTMKTFVVDDGGKIIGSYFIKANQPGLGSHIANCGYIVHPDARGKGIGHQLCEHSIIKAKELGYQGMQFNLVVSTNTRAVKLWERSGFQIIGTIPKGFAHRQQGFVDAYIMFRGID
jgi:ribosomal protein S18 acetylase RimI-like enzyme